MLQNTYTIYFPLTIYAYNNAEYVQSKFKKETDKNRSKLVGDIMKLFCNDENQLQNMLEEEKDKKEKKQFAYFKILKKNGERVSDNKIVRPKHRKKKNDSCNQTLHCEEILVEPIEEYLENIQGDVKAILIYSYYSPCLKRENNIEPCMFLLRRKACEWHSKYGCATYVQYNESWGLRGLNYLKNLRYSEISDYDDVLKQYGDKFQLESERIKNLLSPMYQIIPTLGLASEKKKALNKEITTVKKKLLKLAESSKTRQEHQDLGHEIIQSLLQSSLILPDHITTLLHEWSEMVMGDLLLSSDTINKLTTHFNTKLVKYFQKRFLGNSCPLKLPCSP